MEGKRDRYCPNSFLSQSTQLHNRGLGLKKEHDIISQHYKLDSNQPVNKEALQLANHAAKRKVNPVGRKQSLNTYRSTNKGLV